MENDYRSIIFQKHLPKIHGFYIKHSVLFSSLCRHKILGHFFGNFGARDEADKGYILMAKERN